MPGSKLPMASAAVNAKQMSRPACLPVLFLFIIQLNPPEAVVNILKMSAAATGYQLSEQQL
jgi:hypothetical protein